MQHTCGTYPRIAFADWSWTTRNLEFKAQWQWGIYLNIIWVTFFIREMIKHNTLYVIGVTILSTIITGQPLDYYGWSSKMIQKRMFITLTLKNVVWDLWIYLYIFWTNMLFPHICQDKTASGIIILEINDCFLSM